jgi:membrane protease YdiL (CAAX protease family)
MTDAAFSAIVQAAVLGGVPFFLFFVFHKWRHRRKFAEVASLAGLQLGVPRYIVYSLAFSVVGLIALLIWSPDLEPFTREGSAQRQFVGLGFGSRALGLAFFSGVVQTGFTEELLFRGLMAGSLSRRLPFLWANLTQALIFLLPHLLVLMVMPDMWAVLPLVFVGALVLGWIRIKSGSMLGSWLIHATGNFAFAMMVAVRTES